jgi:hypothetical protein
MTISGFGFFPDTDDTGSYGDVPITVDLDDALRAQFGAGQRVESLPIFTTLVGEVALTVVRVTHQRRTRYQLYAITHDTWTLAAVYGCYTDAMSELLRWRRYLHRGGTVTEWQLAHPDGVYPERSGF